MNPEEKQQIFLEKKAVKEWQLNSNKDPNVRKYHKKVVDTRLYGLYKLLAYIFILIVIVLIVTMFPNVDFHYITNSIKFLKNMTG